MLSTRTVLKENDLYLVGDRHYDVAEGESGLYRRDTRFLSRYEWRLGGERPQHLMQHERYPFWLREHSANANVGYTMEVGLARDLTVTGSEVRDTMTRHPLSRRRAARPDPDAGRRFRGHVRGARLARPDRGAAGERSGAGRRSGVEFSYVALDGLQSRALVQVSPPAEWDGWAAELDAEWSRDPHHGQRVSPCKAPRRLFPATPRRWPPNTTRCGSELGRSRLSDPLDQQVLEQSVRRPAKPVVSHPAGTISGGGPALVRGSVWPRQPDHRPDGQRSSAGNGAGGGALSGRPAGHASTTRRRWRNPARSCTRSGWAS